MKGVIIWKGKYGATRQYVEWLAADLLLPVLTTEQATATELAKYDFVVLGSSVYVGKLCFKKWLNASAELLSSKKLFVFVVCATKPHEQTKLHEIQRTNVPGILVNQVTLFFLRGRLAKKHLSLLDRFILWLGANLQKDPKVKKEMLTDFDDVQRQNIIPLVKEVKAFSKQTTHPSAVL